MEGGGPLDEARAPSGPTGAAPSAKLPATVRIGYGLGSLCTGTFATVPGLLLLYYLTNVMAVPAAAAGIALFLPKAWDVLINPLVGALSDRSRLRGGPRRPFLLAGACTLPPLFALIFAAPPCAGRPRPDTWRSSSCWPRPPTPSSRSRT